MKGVDRALLFLGRALAACGALATACIFALVLSAVVMRYGVGAPLRITEEFSGLLLASSVFLTVPFTVAVHRNIRISLLADRVDGVFRRSLWVVGQVILVAFFAVFAWEAYKSTAFTVRLNLATDVARVPLAPFMIIMTAALSAAGLIAVWQMLRPPPGRTDIEDR